MKPTDEEPDEETEEQSESSSFRLQLRDFRISDASVRYEDDSTRMAFSTAPLSLRLRGDMSAARTDLALKLDATIAADLKNNRFTFTDNTFRLNAIALSLDGWVHLKESGAVAMNLTAGCGKVLFKDVLSLIPAFYTKDFRNLSASGELALDVWAKGEMHGSVLPAFAAKATVSNGSFQYSSLPTFSLRQGFPIPAVR